MSEQKFYKTRIVLEVLSEGPLEWDSLEGLVADITDGPYSGDVVEETSTELSRKEMAQALRDQRSDPDFLLGEPDWTEELSEGDEVNFQGEVHRVLEVPHVEPYEASPDDVFILGPEDKNVWQKVEARREELA